MHLELDIMITSIALMKSKLRKLLAGLSARVWKDI